MCLFKELQEFMIHQKIPPHIAVAEVAMPVDCRGKLLHPLDLPQQLSHLDYPVTSGFCHCLILLFVFAFSATFPSSEVLSQIWPTNKFCCTSSGTEMTVL